MKRLKTIALIISMLIFSFSSFAQGKLKKSKEEVSQKKTEQPTTERSNQDNSSSNEGIGYGFRMFVGKVLYYATVYVAVGNYRQEEHLHHTLTKFPYNDVDIGNYTPTYQDELKKTFRIDLSNQFLIGNESYGNHFKLKIRPLQYFYFQADYYELIEPVPFESQVENLSLFNLNFCYDRLRFEKFNLGWTLGANYIANGINEFGFTYGLNSEVFFPKNLSLFAAIKGSFINDEPVDEFEVSMRYYRNRFSVLLGYERIKIASPVFNFFAVGASIYL